MGKYLYLNLPSDDFRITHNPPRKIVRPQAITVVSFTRKTNIYQTEPRARTTLRPGPDSRAHVNNFSF